MPLVGFFHRLEGVKHDDTRNSLDILGTGQNVEQGFPKGISSQSKMGEQEFTSKGLTYFGVDNNKRTAEKC